MTDAPLDTPDAGAVVSDDMPCARCGYNVRGLTYDGRCPECFTPVARSVHGNLLRYAEPAWLEKVKFGIVLKLWNLLIGVVISVVAGIGVAFGFPMALMQVAGLIGVCLGLWALFLVTSPEPTVGTGDAVGTLRKVIRTAAVLGFFGGQLQQIAPGRMILVVFVAILGLAGIVAMFGEFVYFRRFARRTPDEELVKSTTVVMWGFVTVSALGSVWSMAVVLFARAAAAGATGPGTGTGGVFLGFLMFGSYIFGLGFLIFGIWYIALLFRYHGVFKTASAQATQLQEQGTPPLAQRVNHDPE